MTIQSRGVATFFDYLRDPAPRRVCVGTACRFAPGWRAPLAGEAAVRCVGRCYAAPSDTGGGDEPIPRRALTSEPVVLRHLLGRQPDLRSLYRPRDPEAVLDALERTGLRGRGGAAFPTAAKWRAALHAAGDAKYVVANGDEGDPGSFVDRLLLEEDPHSVLAGLLACARTIGASTAYVYVRAEYPRAASRAREAIEEARSAGLLPRAFEVRVHVGAGSYVCGEETALLRSIEGLRGEAQPKPPYPTERGLFGRPTVVQNVETLAVVPWVLDERRRPTSKGFSLSGAVRAPGVVEAPFGTSLREILDEGGGGPARGARWKMALVGGPMGRVVPAGSFDVALDPATLTGLGHGGIVVLGDDVPVRALAEHLFEFAAVESCGSCTPCRVGTTQLASRRDRRDLERLLDTLEIGSLCGFGTGVPRPLRDLLAHFGDEAFA